MKKKLVLPLLSLFFFVFFCSESMKKNTIIEINLNQGWKFKQADKEELLPAKIPGTVHTDLLENDLIEDPFYRTNEKDQQWIDKKDWEYQLSFQADSSLLNKERIDLVFEGLDTYADVFLNDTLILSANNMFRTWKKDCKPLLKQGKNDLKVYFHSPIKIDIPKFDSLGYTLPANNDQSERGGLGDKKISVFARKAPYHYGWDWGPRFVTMGIWRPVYLKAWDKTQIQSIQVIQNEITDSVANLTALIELEALDKFPAEIIIKDQTNKVYKKIKQTISPETKTIKIDFTIAEPRLWWSNGLGEPNLYQFDFEILHQGEILDHKQETIGLRTLKLVQEPDSLGKSFYFELNGVPVFAKGANYIPNDNFLPRVTHEKYKEILKSAKDANMNMIRVWGGGIYENDIFYDLCDSLGLLVWQDFMFACSMYPGDEDFLENVKQEAIDNVKRLRNHPCLALWCGNNEMDAAWGHNTDQGWKWKEKYSDDIRAKIWNDYVNIFYKILPDVIEKYDPQTPYWWSSPQAGENQRASYSTTSGDVHYWGVWHGREPFEKFEEVIVRFMSEYGLQSFPNFNTVKRFTIEEDWDIRSEVMDAHQRSGVGNELIKDYLKMYYQEPKDFENFLYMSQVLQAEGIKSAIETHRRNMPYCMGTLYWQLNDCWPVASWSSLDYYGNWKALQYFAKKAYQPLLVSPDIDDDQLEISIVSDLTEKIEVNLLIEVIDFKGKNLFTKKIPATIDPNSSSVFYKTDLNELVENKLKDKSFLKTQVIHNDSILSQNITYFKAVKDLKLPKPEININLFTEGNETTIELQSDQLAKNIYLYLEDMQVFFSDNYFDLLPNELKKIVIKTDEKKPIDQEQIKILSVADSFEK